MQGDLQYLMLGIPSGLLRPLASPIHHPVSDAVHSDSLAVPDTLGDAVRFLD